MNSITKAKLAKLTRFKSHRENRACELPFKKWSSEMSREQIKHWHREISDESIKKSQLGSESPARRI